MNGLLKFSAVLFSAFTYNATGQVRSIDEGINLFYVDAAWGEVSKNIYTCDATTMLGLDETIKYVQNFSSASCIDLQKSKLKTLFNLKVIQGQVYFKMLDHYTDERIYSVVFYLSSPKNSEGKSNFIETIEACFGEAHRWTHPNTDEIVRMDWNTEKSFCCVQLGYNMSTNETMDYFTIDISQNYVE